MKKNIIIFTGLLLIVLVGCWYFFINKNNVKNTTSNSDFILKEYYIFNTPDNLIYINNKYNYYMGLPSDWQIVADYPGSNLEKKSFVSETIQPETEDLELSSGMQITVFIQNINNQTLREYINNIYSEFGIMHERKFIVNGLSAVELGTDDLSKSISTYIQKDNLIYSISAHFNGDHYLDLYRDIVANNFFITDNLYQDITDPEDKFLGTDDCMTNPEFLGLIARAQAGEMKKSVVNNQEFIITPNYENWSNEKFVGFNQDETAICAVGGRYPLEVYDDQLIWHRNLQ